MEKVEIKTDNERDFALIDVYRKLAVAEKQIENGEVIDASAVFEKLKEMAIDKYMVDVSLAANNDLNADNPQ